MTPLRDAAAHEWLRARGVTADPAASLALVAQEWTAPGIVLRRMWHTAATLRRPSADAGAVVLAIPLEGVVAFEAADGSTATVARGRFAALPDSATLRTTAPSARLELLSRLRGPSPSPAARSSAALPVLVATANAILDATLDPRERCREGLGSALEGLLAAVLADSVP